MKICKKMLIFSSKVTKNVEECIKNCSYSSTYFLLEGVQRLKFAEFVHFFRKDSLWTSKKRNLGKKDGELTKLGVISAWEDAFDLKSWSILINIQQKLTKGTLIKIITFVTAF